jgi:hypothetical protein
MSTTTPHVSALAQVEQRVRDALAARDAARVADHDPAGDVPATAGHRVGVEGPDRSV